MQYLSLQCAALRGEPLRHFQSAGGAPWPPTRQDAGCSSLQAPAASSQYWYRRMSQKLGSWPCGTASTHEQASKVASEVDSVSGGCCGTSCKGRHAAIPAVRCKRGRATSPHLGIDLTPLAALWKVSTGVCYHQLASARTAAAGVAAAAAAAAAAAVGLADCRWCRRRRTAAAAARRYSSLQFRYQAIRRPPLCRKRCQHDQHQH